MLIPTIQCTYMETIPNAIPGKEMLRIKDRQEMILYGPLTKLITT